MVGNSRPKANNEFSAKNQSWSRIANCGENISFSRYFFVFYRLFLDLVLLLVRCFVENLKRKISLSSRSMLRDLLLEDTDIRKNTVIFLVTDIW